MRRRPNLTRIHIPGSAYSVRTRGGVAMLRLTFPASDARMSAQAGFFPSVETWNIEKAGAWLLVRALVAVANVRLVAGPPAIPADTVLLGIRLKIISVSCNIPLHIGGAGYRFGIFPRSQPIC